MVNSGTKLVQVTIIIKIIEQFSYYMHGEVLYWIDHWESANK